MVHLHIPRHGEHHAVGGITRLHEVFEPLRSETLHITLGTQDIVSQGVALVGQFLVLVVNKLCRQVVVGVYLLYHHFALAFYLPFGEGAMEKDIGKEFETALEVLVERGGIDAGLLLGGEGVELASHTVDTVEDMVGATVFGAFEERVLDKMGHTLIGSALVARPDANKHSGIGNPAVAAAQDYLHPVAECVVFVHIFS